MCVHGLARWEPDLFKQLQQRLLASRSAAASRSLAEEAAPLRQSESRYDRPGVGGGVESSALHAAALGARGDEKEAQAREEGQEAADVGVYHALLRRGCCVDGALAFVGHYKKWAYREATGGDDADGDATTGGGGEEGGGETGGGEAGRADRSRQPGVDAKRRLEQLLPPEEVCEETC